MLLSRNQLPPLLDLSDCYRLFSPSWVSQHSHIRAEDPPSAATPAALWAGHVRFIPQLPPVSAVISGLQADFGPSSPTAALTLADLRGMSDVLTYLLFQSRCLRG